MKKHKALLLFLLTFLAYITIITLKQHSNKIYHVRIINGFTNNSSVPLVVWCAAPDRGDIGGRALQERDDYSWSVVVGLTWSSARFECTMKWEGRRKKFEAFRASRDRRRCGGGGQCIWLVKEDGFYFGNDGVHWTKVFPWVL